MHARPRPGQVARFAHNARAPTRARSRSPTCGGRLPDGCHRPSGSPERRATSALRAAVNRTDTTILAGSSIADPGIPRPATPQSPPTSKTAAELVKRGPPVSHHEFLHPSGLVQRGDLLISASCSRCEAVLGLSAVRKCTPWRAWIWAPRSGNPRGPGPACGGCVSPPLVWAPAVVEPPSLDSGSDAGADALSDVRDVIELPRGDLDDERVCLVVGEGEPVAVESQEGDGGR